MSQVLVLGPPRFEESPGRTAFPRSKEGHPAEYQGDGPIRTVLEVLSFPPSFTWKERVPPRCVLEERSEADDEGRDVTGDHRYLR